ncbi:hypothetical protein [Micromonospora sp. WMMD737]|uniref:hypothetical protein n=1 Tax=Micromonospora sp. WMMD737 TaxID=3404113 RepID=UPI003B9641D9
MELHVAPASIKIIREIAQLRAEIHSARPSARFTKATAVVAAMALLDWVAILIHAVLGDVGTFFATHLGFAATISVIAAVGGVGWLIMQEQCRREVKRDEIEELRHQERTRMVNQVLREGFNQYWKGFVDGVQETRAGRATPPTRPSGVTPLWPRTQGRNRGRHPG